MKVTVYESPIGREDEDTIVAAVEGGEAVCKAVLEYPLPEYRSQFMMAVKGSAAHCALWDISQNIFRGYRKHGYPDRRLQALLDDEVAGEKVAEAIGLLKEKFYEIVNEHAVNPHNEEFQ